MTTTSSRTARPYSFGPLYDLLMDRFPKHRSAQGVLDVPKLAKDIKRSHEGVYKWLRENKITVDGAKRLVELSKDRVKYEEFLPFLFA